MAGRNYEMAFVMNAALNGGFKGTLSTAQQEFTRLGREIQSVNRLQSDIAGYRKQQAAVQNTTARLQNLREQEEQLTVQLEAMKSAQD